MTRTDGIFEIEAQKDVRADAADAVIKAGGRLQSLTVESQSLDDIYTHYFEEVSKSPSTKSSNKRDEREGSPWTGLTAVMTKEMADHLTGARVLILEVLVLLTAVGTLFTALKSITTTSDNQFVYLNLFTTAQDPLPAFVFFLAILVPLIAIALSFDLINGEFNRRTLSRILAQPVYRDALLLGKFLGGLLTLTMVFSAIWLLIFGVGIVKLRVPPTAEETGRALWFLLATIFYGGIWMALAMLFSTVFRSSATAALSSIAVWAFFIFFWKSWWVCSRRY